MILYDPYNPLDPSAEALVSAGRQHSYRAPNGTVLVWYRVPTIPITKFSMNTILYHTNSDTMVLVLVWYPFAGEFWTSDPVA
jgi:hypothetical protein